MVSKRSVRVLSLVLCKREPASQSLVHDVAEVVHSDCDERRCHADQMQNFFGSDSEGAKATRAAMDLRALSALHQRSYYRQLHGHSTHRSQR